MYNRASEKEILQLARVFNACNKLEYSNFLLGKCRCKRLLRRHSLQTSASGLQISANGVHYSQIGRYEEIGAQPSADVLAKLANALEVSSDFLMNGSSDELAGNTLTDKELLNQFKIIEKLPEQDRSVVKIFLDAFITKRKIQQLAN